jgi:hypothetical protein
MDFPTKVAHARNHLLFLTAGAEPIADIQAALTQLATEADAAVVANEAARAEAAAAAAADVNVITDVPAA